MIMTKKDKDEKPSARTTVTVTVEVNAILRKYKALYGDLKRPASVGLLLFDTLTAEDREACVAAFEQADSDPNEILAVLRYLVWRLPDSLDGLAVPPLEAQAIGLYRPIALAASGDKRKKAEKTIVRTSMVFTTAAQRILQKYRYSYGLKGPICVGMMMFDKLTRDEQLDRMFAAAQADDDPQAVLSLMRELARRMPERQMAKIVRPDEAEAFRFFRDAVVSGTEVRDDVSRVDAEAPIAERKRTSRRRSP